ncbi:MAG: hypothetical protein CME66_07120 [Halobacteriovoraceae bacterium]|nr:hypothetical protein [Halobacteriovoraceae bacterium]
MSLAIILLKDGVVSLHYILESADKSFRRSMMYYAKGMRELLQTTQLSMEFFEDLDDFQIHFIEMCFRQSIDDKMGLMSEVERYNLHLFEEFKIKQIEDMYGIEAEFFKKSA